MNIILFLVCILAHGHGKESASTIAKPTKPELNGDCGLQRESGPCRASFRRFYYDVETDDCALFVYGGCMGNGNNFASFAECRQKCKKQKTSTIPPQMKVTLVEQVKVTQAPQITINYRHFKRLCKDC